MVNLHIFHGSFVFWLDRKRLVAWKEKAGRKPMLLLGARQVGKTLLILDEIQECPAALTSLKYFCEELPQLHVAAAGSLLGLYEHHGTGFPVGKVNIYHLYPMNYLEFALLKITVDK